MAVGIAIGLLLDHAGMYQDGEKSHEDTPYARLETKQLRARLFALVGLLKAQEQRVIRCHYFHGMTFEQVSLDLGLTKGRVSQIHSAAIKALCDLNRADNKSKVSI